MFFSVLSSVVVVVVVVVVFVVVVVVVVVVFVVNFGPSLVSLVSSVRLSGSDL